MYYRYFIPFPKDSEDNHPDIIRTYDYRLFTAYTASGLHLAITASTDPGGPVHYQKYCDYRAGFWRCSQYPAII